MNDNRNVKVVLILSLVLALYAAVFVTLNLIKPQELGYIDSAILMAQYPDAVDARQTFAMESEVWNNNILTLENELNVLNQELIDKGASMKQAQIEEKQKIIADKQQEYFRYRKAIDDKAAKREQELLQPVMDNLNAEIEEFGKAEGYKIILGTVQGGNILYAVNSVNLTYKFLDYITEKGE